MAPPSSSKIGGAPAELTIEQTLAAMNDSTIMNQFASQTGLDGGMTPTNPIIDPTNLSLPTSAILGKRSAENDEEEDILPPRLLQQDQKM